MDEILGQLQAKQLEIDPIMNEMKNESPYNFLKI